MIAVDMLSPEHTEPHPPWTLAESVKAPFPAFGGKSRAASLVWERFGQVVNYVEPFANSAAVLLACPADIQPRVETLNDINCFIANFWRATAWDPEAVARWSDWPVLEADLHSRHRWLLRMAKLLRARIEADPGYYDARVAGWWVWGASAWIGSGWAEDTGGATPAFGRGVHASRTLDPSRRLPRFGSAAPSGESRESGGAAGVHGRGMRSPSSRLPDLSGGTQWGTDEPNARAGRGIHSERTRGPSRQLPALGGGGASNQSLNAISARTRLYDIFAALSARLRYTRVACGDWARICTPAVTYRHGLTAVFLDPPYDGYEHVYGAAKADEPLSAKVRAWALENGARDDMRIALCGYDGEHDALEAAGWEVVSWKAKGGYANQRLDGENANKHRERIWFSPACLRPGARLVREAPRHDDLPLFAGRTP